MYLLIIAVNVTFIFSIHVHAYNTCTPRGMLLFSKILHNQGLQILLMSGVSVTSASQILESFWNIWSQVSQRKKPFSDFPACGPSMYTLALWIHKVVVAVR